MSRWNLCFISFSVSAPRYPVRLRNTESQAAYPSAPADSCGQRPGCLPWKRWQMGPSIYITPKNSIISQRLPVQISSFPIKMEDDQGCQGQYDVKCQQSVSHGIRSAGPPEGNNRYRPDQKINANQQCLREFLPALYTLVLISRCLIIASSPFNSLSRLTE